MSNPTQDTKQVERLTFFSDAVFAIAITLLIIEVHVPELPPHSTDRELLQSLLHLVPNFVGYLVSFWSIGAFWVSHHEAFAWLVRQDKTLVWTNLRFLFPIAFLPFPTAVMSAHIDLASAQIFYALSLMFAAMMQVLLWRYAFGAGNLMDPQAPAKQVRALRRRAWALPLTGGIAIAVALWMPTLAVIPLSATPWVRRLLVRFTLPA